MNIGAMAAEFGVLPSTVIFGSDALEQRTPWHVAFDFAVWRQFAKARDDAVKQQSRANNKPRGKTYTGDNLPDPTPYKRR